MTLFAGVLLARKPANRRIGAPAVISYQDGGQRPLCRRRKRAGLKHDATNETDAGRRTNAPRKLTLNRWRVTGNCGVERKSSSFTDVKHVK
jgi:hypothetical protein